ncbi:glycosyltransferase family 2 protein [Paenibacillus mesophilus]|uniref:glycosyltransferase family 2 protein n=1 Tax=Paenibacillus mesophilus TaxID=2582849 RepID=UPI00110E09B3|nr:glycosyltransferase family 2 protein [Paenibacillus mesophilus]TMV50000.1 glycosyltransferase family 2 protein [Paenibacillus mesophilus]
MMKISVVMAVYNGERYLEQAVNSVLAQTYDNFELIVVDDGSTDRTPEILGTIADSRVKKIRRTANHGAAKILNFAVGKADGDWIAIHDADDISMPERLSVQADYIRKRPELVAVGSRIACIGGNGVDPVQLRRAETNLNFGTGGEQLYRNRYLVCPMCHGSSLFSKEAFLKAGGYDPTYRIAYDYDLWLRLFQIGPIEKVEQVLYQYRIHSDSLSRRNGARTYMEKLRCCIRRLREFEYSHLAMEPRFAVFANRKLTRDIARKVFPHCPVRIHYYFDSSKNAKHPEQAAALLNEGRIDGILLLQKQERSELTRFFLEQGLTLNRNLFSL